MPENQIHALLKKNLGLRIESIGENCVERAVHRRCRALGLAGREAYLAHLAQTPAELGELVEEVVIPETWFFRDSTPFTAVVEHALGPWTARHPGQTLRLLSVPCSTGEEPYSLAMALSAAGWPQDKMRIEAVDISRRALDRARQGQYTTNSFRGDCQSFRDRYFTCTAGLCRIDARIKEKVRFRHGNLLDPFFMAGLGSFDIVFCRNVLIYLDEEARQQAINSLARLLTADGLLCTGHAEAGLFLDSPFTPAPHRLSFAFCKKNGSPPTASPPPPAPDRPRPTPAPQRQTAPPPAPAGSGPAPAYLATAQKAADLGHLDEARALCEQGLQRHGPSAAAFFLLGVVLNAAGEQDAALTALRKAVYLEPEHGQALLLLALLAEKLGDRQLAKAYRQRALRCQDDKDDR
jgi:chemotaxis protein methyltransferase WspC